jgi:hypothetical protein
MPHFARRYVLGIIMLLPVITVPNVRSSTVSRFYRALCAPSLSLSQICIISQGEFETSEQFVRNPISKLRAAWISLSPDSNAQLFSLTVCNELKLLKSILCVKALQCAII